MIEHIDTREALRRVAGEVAVTRPPKGVIGKPKVERPRDSQPAAVERRHQVYKAMLRYPALSDDHLRHLVSERKSREEDVRRLEYRTRSFADSETIPALICMDLGEGALNNVPGFYRRDGRWWLGGTPGIVIPVRDVEGRIQGCQIRANDPDTVATSGPRPRGKRVGLRQERRAMWCGRGKDRHGECSSRRGR